MKQRRNLVEGLTETPNVNELENQFVYGEADQAAADVAIEASTAPAVSDGVMSQFKGRVPLTTRCRPEVASALKRASLERQLNGMEPYRMQEIVEIALESWLRGNGYSA